MSESAQNATTEQKQQQQQQRRQDLQSLSANLEKLLPVVAANVGRFILKRELIREDILASGTTVDLQGKGLAEWLATQSESAERSKQESDSTAYSEEEGSGMFNRQKTRSKE
jgi:hypothetical protein